MLKLYFYTKFVITPNMFRFILIIFRELFHIGKTYIKKVDGLINT